VLGRRGPVGRDVRERREWSFPIHRRDSPIQAQRVCLRRKAALSEHCLERPELAEQVCGPLLSDATRAGNPVRWISTQGDEVGYLGGIDPVALANLGRSDTRWCASTHRLEDRRPRWRAERRPIRRRNERLSTGGLFEVNGSSEKVVGLIARVLRTRKAGRGSQRREEVELLEQLRFEHTAGLIALESRVAIGGDIERVPCDENGPRALLLPEPQKHVRETHEGVGRATVSSTHRLEGA
jgi:hypothetical protein